MLTLSEPPPSTATPPSAVKGSVVGALVTVIRERGLRDRVAGRVTPEVRALLDDPPLPTMWVDMRLSVPLYQAVYEVVGPDQMRSVGREAITRGLQPLLRATIERVLAVFGTSPATLLARIDRAAGGTMRGIVYQYTPIDDTSGVFEMELTGLEDVPVGVFYSTAGGLEIVFDFCKVRGSFGDPERVPNGKNNRVRYVVRWRSITLR